MENSKNDMCDINFVNEEKVASVRKKMKPDETMQRIAETFKVLGDPTRIKIIFALSQEELCVCDIANLLGATRTAISHQLRVLRNLRLVKYRKEGKMAFYSLDDEHIENLFAEGMRHVEEE
ncbi:MAG: winged helix-turn-helix transcriptional regulator [Deltaproteobacteria bacterium]|nr:winged helix-turn-helix transcriptional regulator [Deltaproteobacteria bacterium]MBW2015459.1 winged helix-turn-helix transcriptional regulator [Deltaproteobacteria bacterium]MBW2128408.1 winged helix-turn-helix transcriptional regulator [Deltaproteobacteria bacterium]MBW2304375.1 winged helix-turn-helix transcriptional regulator [Deltaproteobacteria bacterium]